MTTTITTVFAVIGGIAATVPAVATAYLKGREALAPLLSRRSLRVVIVATEEKQPAAIAFANARCEVAATVKWHSPEFQKPLVERMPW